MQLFDIAQGDLLNTHRCKRLQHFMEQRSFGLDLLRAVAIMLVLFAHLTPSLVQLVGAPNLYPSTLVATSGFLGVEVFFVLSGFLIGNILLRALHQKVDVKNWLIFMIRRWARTLPLYLIWLAVIAALLPPTSHVGRHILTYAVFAQNLIQAMPADNWFGVSWSLAVEEWFYLIFSATLFLLWQATPRHAFKICCALFIVVPLLGRFYVGAGDWDAVARKVVLLRLDAIAYGVAFAGVWVRFRHYIEVLRVPGAIFGLIVLGALLVQANQFATWPHVSLILFNVASLSTVLCLPMLASLKAGPTVWLSPVRWLSQRSYALYLMHLSILELVFKYLQPHTQLGGFVAAALIVIGSGVGAECSFRYLEQPILRRRPSAGSHIGPKLWAKSSELSRESA